MFVVEPLLSSALETTSTTDTPGIISETLPTSVTKLWATYDKGVRNDIELYNLSGWGIVELDVDNLDNYPEAFWSIVTTIQHGKPSTGCLPWDTAIRTVLRGGRYWHMKECPFGSHISISDSALDYPVSRVLRYLIKNPDDSRYPKSVTLYGEMPHVVSLSDCLPITCHKSWPNLANQKISTLRLQECCHENLVTLQQMQNLKHLHIIRECPLAITTILATQPKLQSLHFTPSSSAAAGGDSPSNVQHLVTLIVNHRHINEISVFSKFGRSHDDQSIINLAFKFHTFIGEQSALDDDCLGIVAKYLFGFYIIDVYPKTTAKRNSVASHCDTDSSFRPSKRRIE